MYVLQTNAVEQQESIGEYRIGDGMQCFCSGLRYVLLVIRRISQSERAKIAATLSLSLLE